MKIKSVSLHRFRKYSTPITIELDDLLVLVGRNDIGKSSILEALDIFFNDGKGCVKLDKDDVNKDGLANGEDSIEISVEFTDLPPNIVIDASNITTLRDEHLLTADGTLRITKKYPGAGKERVFIIAKHLINPECKDLLLKKQSDLRAILASQAIDCTDRTKNAVMRAAIWAAQETLDCADEYEIEVAKIDAKNIWEQVKKYMPLYTLFQADRKNSDSDSEVQDPMRIAVKEILGDSAIKASLDSVAATVKERLDAVAASTLQKLQEMNPNIASSLDPQLPDLASLKWIDVFKSVSITGDNDIPINKRGSGVKRLVLISFFRAESERRQREAQLPNVVYAIEEPETSQHPDHQRALIDALVSLSSAANTQVVLTTHSPEIVKKLQFHNLLLVTDSCPEGVQQVDEQDLPYPSLNEVNYAAFGEASCEYHNELYGYLDVEAHLATFTNGKPLQSYIQLHPNGTTSVRQLTLTQIIRHQIHHPENPHNQPFSSQDLADSIALMRAFISNGFQ
jgi:predicted ATP-dependent endonuclease of OLD family